MEIFILIGVVLVGLVVLLWFRTKKTTVVKVEEPVVAQTEVASVVVKEEPVVHEKVEQVAPVVIDEVVPEVVKPVKKPKAKKPTAAQAIAPKPKRTRKPKA